MVAESGAFVQTMFIAWILTCELTSMEYYLYIYAYLY